MQNTTKLCLVCGTKIAPTIYKDRNRIVYRKCCSEQCRAKDNFRKHRNYYKNYWLTRAHLFSWKKKRECKLCKNSFLPQTENQIYCNNPCNAKKAWKINNREKYLEMGRKYNRKRANDPEAKKRDKIATKKWRSNNPDKNRWYKYKRRASEKIGNGFTEKEWQAMKERYGNKCLACYKESGLTQDHIKPLTLGGKHEDENIQPLCMTCNRKKQQKIICYKCNFRSVCET